MPLFSFRMKDGNSVIVYVQDQRSATEVLREMGLQSTVAPYHILESSQAETFWKPHLGKLAECSTLQALRTRKRECAPAAPSMKARTSFFMEERFQP
jgi:hypothetical protein